MYFISNNKILNNIKFLYFCSKNYENSILKQYNLLNFSIFWWNEFTNYCEKIICLLIVTKLIEFWENYNSVKKLVKITGIKVSNIFRSKNWKQISAWVFKTLVIFIYLNIFTTFIQLLFLSLPFISLFIFTMAKTFI